jgi:hypothetical protein
VLQPAEPGTVPQPRSPRTAANDIVNTRRESRHRPGQDRVAGRSRRRRARKRTRATRWRSTGCPGFWSAVISGGARTGRRTAPHTRGRTWAMASDVCWVRWTSAQCWRQRQSWSAKSCWAACWLDGYPAIAGAAADGTVTPLHAQHGSFPGSPGPSANIKQPGGADRQAIPGLRRQLPDDREKARQEHRHHRDRPQAADPRLAPARPDASRRYRHAANATVKTAGSPSPG